MPQFSIATVWSIYYASGVNLCVKRTNIKIVDLKAILSAEEMRRKKKPLTTSVSNLGSGYSMSKICSYKGKTRAVTSSANPAWGKFRGVAAEFPS
jgi:hypothetical protein